MGLTALSLVCSVLVLRLVSADYKDVPEGLRKVGFMNMNREKADSSFTLNYRYIRVKGTYLFLIICVVCCPVQ